MNHKSGVMQKVIREKKIYCGDRYLEVDIYPYTIYPTKGKRSKKEKESLLSQKNLNDKNRKRKFLQLAEANFGQGDIHLSLTYNDRFMPQTREEAERMLQNFFRRVKRRRAKRNLPALKYMVIISYHEPSDEQGIRPHYHILMNGGLTRDELEELWSIKGESIGYANAKRLQQNPNTGFQQISYYLTKHNTNKKSWSCSQNLERPVSRTNDHKYSRREIQRIVMKGPDHEYWEKKYPGWKITDQLGGYEAVYHDEIGWSIYLKMRKIE